jgi:hypothetical protein
MVVGGLGRLVSVLRTVWCMRTGAVADRAVPSAGVFGAATGAGLMFSVRGLSAMLGVGMAATGATGARRSTLVVAMEPLCDVISGTDAAPPARARIPAAASRVNRLGARRRSWASMDSGKMVAKDSRRGTSIWAGVWTWEPVSPEAPTVVGTGVTVVLRSDRVLRSDGDASAVPASGGRISSSNSVRSSHLSARSLWR